MADESIAEYLRQHLADYIASKKLAGLNKARAAKIADHPTLAQDEFKQARAAMLGNEFSTDPAGQPRVPCMVNAKCKRREERKSLIPAATGASDDLKAPAARLRQQMDDLEHARVAEAFYMNLDSPADLQKPPPDFLEPTADDYDALGIDKSMLSVPGSDFKAAVYKKDPLVWGDDPKPPYDLVFKGSSLVEGDWKNNFRQGLGAQSDY